MNINVSVDCSPEEARRLMGLPDLQPIHELYLARLREAVTEGLSPETMERMIGAWSPIGDAGINAWRQMMDRMIGKSG